MRIPSAHQTDHLDTSNVTVTRESFFDIDKYRIHWNSIWFAVLHLKACQDCSAFYDCMNKYHIEANCWYDISSSLLGRHIPLEPILRLECAPYYLVWVTCYSFFKSKFQFYMMSLLKISALFWRFIFIRKKISRTYFWRMKMLINFFRWLWSE